MAVNDIVMGAAGASGPATYVEDVFSTYLYTGNDSTQTITNGIDLSGKGGLVWTKDRTDAVGHRLKDTTLGTTYFLESNSTSAQIFGNYSWQFNSNGYQFTTGNSSFNYLGSNYASWTFRKQPKFFDIVTWTGDGSGSRVVSHALVSQPGFIIIKLTSGVDAWTVAASDGSGNYKFLNLNSTAAAMDTSTQSLVASSSGINVGWISSNWAGVNGNGATYVAYLFAHDAGGFGATGTDNVISCGSWTGTGTTPGPVVTLGYEPQWVMWKRSDAGTEQWHIRDVMRGMPVTASGQDLYADSASATGNTTNEGLIPTATGFQVIGTNTNANTNGGTYIYIAIRRPMKTPTSGTEVFNPNTNYTTISSGKFGVTTGFPVDALWWRKTAATTAAYQNGWMTRLQGTTEDLKPYSNAAAAYNIAPLFDYSTKVAQQAENTGSQIYWSFKRAPSFFDVVCYTGTGVAGTVNHNLGVAPELMIVKQRSSANDGVVYTASSGNGYYLRLFSTSSDSGNTPTAGLLWNNTDPTATVFSVGSGTNTNGSGSTYVAYLFATCAGVSKVGSYTGNGSSQTIPCGFTTGARFVMIKKSTSTAPDRDWFVWDSARGIVSGNDPHLSPNTTAAEVTTDDSVDADASGFIVNQDAATDINVNGVSYIFLAIS